jgi:tripartite-type tricarboxylate transporter receptor subunit TctC
MRRLLSALLIACAIGLTATPAGAQDKFPNRPLKIMVAFAPGSATDIIARVLAEYLRPILGQSVIVENRPGAFGIIAIEEMARSKPDGHTLMLGNISTSVVTPLLYRKKFQINPETDIVVVSRIAEMPSVFAVTTRNFPPKTLAEFVAYAKERPGKVLYSTNAVGSYPHYDTEILAKHLGIRLSHVPVKEGPPGFMKDMAAGDIHAAPINIASALPFLRGGQLRALYTNANERLKEFPDVPTTTELGINDVGSRLWSALFAPASTPPAVLQALNGAIQQALNSDALKQTYSKQHIVPSPSGSLAETKTWLSGQFDRWRSRIASVKIDIPE